MFNRIAGALHFSRSRGRGTVASSAANGSEAKRPRASSRDAVANYTNGGASPSKEFSNGKTGAKKESVQDSRESNSVELTPSRTRPQDLRHMDLEARQAEEKDFIMQHDTPEAQLWYLVDVRWLTEWKHFVTHKGPLPGAIDNSRLIDRETGRPRPGLRPVDDYRGVNSAIWNFWHQRYDGGPVVRRKQLDLYSPDVEDSDPASFKRGNDMFLPGTAGTSSSTAGTQAPSPSSATSISLPRAEASRDGNLSSSSHRASQASSLDETVRTAERQSQASSSRRSSGTSGAARGQSVPAARVSGRKLPPAAELDGSSSKPFCCDKCDGPHETDNCPHFKKAREKHADAWSSYGKSKMYKGGSSCENVPIVRNARVIPQPADGSCLFHSLSYGLADRTNASSLRREICSFIAANPDMTISDTSIKDWVKYDSNESVSSYAQRMSGGTWGGGIEMAALTKLRTVNVHVYEKVPEGYRRISAFENSNASKTINVLYQGRMHYDALVM
eukprot:TRINITY_DN78555_c0_g1_i1.p1 TRINITY_DN78555_c0_g1~~TRINITY_DN78555_c0_g1_i1.p1  ORF type:complete len:501 (+),score=89.57 TRINITY_DN78555_c0_g1_i1:72-1574(+)